MLPLTEAELLFGGIGVSLVKVDFEEGWEVICGSGIASVFAAALAAASCVMRAVVVDIRGGGNFLLAASVVTTGRGMCFRLFVVACEIVVLTPGPVLAATTFCCGDDGSLESRLSEKRLVERYRMLEFLLHYNED